MNKIYNNNKGPFKVVKIMIDSERYACSGFGKLREIFLLERSGLYLFCGATTFFNDFMPVKPVKLARIIQKLYLACLKMNKNVVNRDKFLTTKQLFWEVV